MQMDGARRKINIEPQPRRDLDTIDYNKYARSVIAVNPSFRMVEDLFAKAAPLISGISTLDCVLRMYSHNPECITVFARHEPEVLKEPEAEGFVAMLPLNEDGHAALFDGRIRTNAPGEEYVCLQNEKPAAVYIWAIYTPPRLSGGVALIMERLSSRKYRDVPLYCKAANDGAEKFFLTLGFTKGTSRFGFHQPDVLHYDRRPFATDEGVPDMSAVEDAGSRPPYDSYDPRSAKTDTVGVKVVHTMDELQQVLAVRAVSYIGEQEIPYDEDADGNDLTCTHLIGYVGREPAGCIRLRYFSAFVKIERLAVLPRFRRSRLAFRLVEAAIAFGRKKGYERFYGQAEESVIPLWRRFGFRPRNTDPIRYMTDKTYREGDLLLSPCEDALTPTSGGYVLLRREGEWERAGLLELNSGDTRGSGKTIHGD